MKSHSIQLVKPWEICANFPISVFDLDFLFDNDFYSDFTILLKEYPDYGRTILGHFQNISYLINQQNLNKHNLANYGYIDLIRDLITKKVSKDSIKDILDNISRGTSYNDIKENYYGFIQEISPDQYRKLKAILKETLNTLDQHNRNKMFYVIRVHFPMLKSEQIVKAIDKITGEIA